MLKLLYWSPTTPTAIIPDRYYGRKRSGASACADIEQSRVRNAIVPVSRYHYEVSLKRISDRMVSSDQIMRGILFELALAERKFELERDLKLLDAKDHARAHALDMAQRE